MSEVKTSLEKLGKKVTNKDCTGPSISKVIDNIVKNYPEGGLVIPNPELEGNEEALSGIETGGVKYKVASGGGVNLKLLTTKVRSKVRVVDWFLSDVDFTTPGNDFEARYIWTDGDNIYYSYTWVEDPSTSSSHLTHLVLDRTTNTWKEKIFNDVGFTWYGTDVWSDGQNIYLSKKIGAQNWSNFILDKATSTWNPVVLTGMDTSDFDLFGGSLWTDGENVYYSHNTYHYIFNRDTKTWTPKTWNGVSNFDGYNVWTDGKNIYCSSGTSHLVLDRDTETWSEITWTGMTSFWGASVWTDGKNCYYDNNMNNTSWILSESNTWKRKNWNIHPNNMNMFYDGNNIYCYLGNHNFYVYTETGIYK